MDFKSKLEIFVLDAFQKETALCASACSTHFARELNLSKLSFPGEGPVAVLLAGTVPILPGIQLTQHHTMPVFPTSRPKKSLLFQIQATYISYPVSCRNDSETVLGIFINPIPLREKCIISITFKMC